MAKDDEQKTAAISIKVTPSLKAKLDRMAKRDRRKLSPYIEVVLEDHVKRSDASEVRKK